MTTRHHKAPANPSVEYADVFTSFWAAGMLPEMRTTCGKPVIMFPITGTDGFFLLLSEGGSPLPADRSHLTGWQLVAYLPENVDPDGTLDEGVVIVDTDTADVAQLIATAVPTMQLIDNAIA